MERILAKGKRPPHADWLRARLFWETTNASFTDAAREIDVSRTAIMDRKKKEKWIKSEEVQDKKSFLKQIISPCVVPLRVASRGINSMEEFQKFVEDPMAISRLKGEDLKAWHRAMTAIAGARLSEAMFRKDAEEIKNMKVAVDALSVIVDTDMKIEESLAENRIEVTLRRDGNTFNSAAVEEEIVDAEPSPDIES
jgi:hypothetical protein